MRQNLPCSRGIHNPSATIARSVVMVNVGKKLQFVMPASGTRSAVGLLKLQYRSQELQACTVLASASASLCGL
jgi:hypothetical protein